MTKAVACAAIPSAWQNTCGDKVERIKHEEYNEKERKGDNQLNDIDKNATKLIHFNGKVTTGVCTKFDSSTRSLPLSNNKKAD